MSEIFRLRALLTFPNLIIVGAQKRWRTEKDSVDIHRELHKGSESMKKLLGADKESKRRHPVGEERVRCSS